LRLKKEEEPQKLLQRLKFLAWLEAHGFSGRDRHFGARARVAANACFSGTDVEDPEAPKLNALAMCKRALHALENGLHCHLGLGFGYAGPVHNFIDDIELYQDILPRTSN
jgi:hypothetical protein